MELFTNVDYSKVLSQQYGSGSSPYSDRHVFNSQKGGISLGWHALIPILGLLGKFHPFDLCIIYIVSK